MCVEKNNLFLNKQKITGKFEITEITENKLK